MGYPPGGMIRANLIKSSQERRWERRGEREERQDRAGLCVSIPLLTAFGERDVSLLEMKHGGGKKGLAYIGERVASALCPVAGG